MTSATSASLAVHPPTSERHVGYFVFLTISHCLLVLGPARALQYTGYSTPSPWTPQLSSVIASLVLRPLFHRCTSSLLLQACLWRPGHPLSPPPGKWASPIEVNPATYPSRTRHNSYPAVGCAVSNVSNVWVCHIQPEDKASMDVLPLRDTQLRDAHTRKSYAPVCLLLYWISTKRVSHPSPVTLPTFAATNSFDVLHRHNTLRKPHVRRYRDCSLLSVTSMTFFEAGYELFSTPNNEKHLDSPNIVVCRFLHAFASSMSSCFSHNMSTLSSSTAVRRLFHPYLTHVVATVPCLPTIPAHSAVSLSTFLVARSSSLASVPQPALPSSTTHIFATLAHIVQQLVSAGVHSFFTHWFHCGGCGSVISFLLPFVEVCRRGNSERNRVTSWPFLSGRSRLHQR